MKKLIITAALLLSATAAQADHHSGYAGLRFETRDGIQGTQDSQAYGFTLGQNINKYFSAEVAGRLKDNDNDTNNTRLELGGVGKLPIEGTKFSLYNRVALGKKFDGSDNDTYWSIEPGARYAITQDLGVKAGIRFREGFQSSIVDSTKTYRLALDYAFTKNTSLTTGVDFLRGDSDSNNFMIGYNIKF